SELSRDVGVKADTVRNYLDYLEKTFIVHRTRPFYTNKRKEITKSPVIYFSDPGLRNYAVQRFGQLNTPSEFGELFEMFIHNFLRRKLRFTSYNVRYWRTKSQAEVDLVVTRGNSPELPVEVKYREMESAETTRSLRSFVEKYSPGKALVVNLSLQETTEINGTKVEFLPYPNLLFQIERLLVDRP
ncbi:MAG: DUF4143 domain-containing protein, partial [Candidatus Nanohaloarchaea archaeon]|nr:DUF4143 domain-containing protein [Candidatus Nanohaloarchaea archaeon]